MGERGELEESRQASAETEAATRDGDAMVSTVGTGSALAIGCIVLAVILVLIALAYRWLGGPW